MVIAELGSLITTLKIKLLGSYLSQQVFFFQFHPQSEKIGDLALFPRLYKTVVVKNLGKNK